MRVFTTAENESIEIGDDLLLTVLEIQDDCVRVGISSLNREPYYREETLYVEPHSAELQLN